MERGRRRHTASMKRGKSWEDGAWFLLSRALLLSGARRRVQAGCRAASLEWPGRWALVEGGRRMQERQIVLPVCSLGGGEEAVGVLMPDYCLRRGCLIWVRRCRQKRAACQCCSHRCTGCLASRTWRCAGCQASCRRCCRADCRASWGWRRGATWARPAAPGPPRRPRWHLPGLRPLCGPARATGRPGSPAGGGEGVRPRQQGRWTEGLQVPFCSGRAAPRTTHRRTHLCS